MRNKKQNIQTRKNKSKANEKNGSIKRVWRDARARRKLTKQALRLSDYMQFSGVEQVSHQNDKITYLRTFTNEVCLLYVISGQYVSGMSSDEFELTYKGPLLSLFHHYEHSYFKFLSTPFNFLNKISLLEEQLQAADTELRAQIIYDDLNLFERIQEKHYQQETALLFVPLKKDEDPIQAHRTIEALLVHFAPRVIYYPSVIEHLIGYLNNLNETLPLEVSFN